MEVSVHFPSFGRVSIHAAPTHAQDSTVTPDRIRRMTFRIRRMTIEIGGGPPFRALAYALKDHREVYRPDGRGAKSQGCCRLGEGSAPISHVHASRKVYQTGQPIVATIDSGARVA